jgi:CheY-like chemotaxis protein
MELALDVAPFRRAPLAARSQRILVAEEDEETRELVVGAFVDEGHDVFGLEGEAELAECLGMIALNALRPPDLIAMGVRMAWHSGIDLLEGIRSEGWATPVVLMTWSAPGSVRHQVQRAGAAAVVAKPFNVTELRRAARCARTKVSGSRGEPFYPQ